MTNWHPDEESVVTLVDGRGGFPLVENVIVGMSFGEPDDSCERSERTVNWVNSFTPGMMERQVSDLFMSDGLVHIILDRMTVTLPVIDLLHLLERADPFGISD